jgi:uncharacterized protein involved in exopolysaccharide biosynthesis
MPDSTTPKTSTVPIPTPESGNEHVVERRTLRDYYVMVRERAWIALPLALLTALGLGYYQMREIPLYESHATLQFERPEKIVMVDQVVDQTPRSEIDINTYLQRLNSASLREKVIGSFTPDEIKVLQRPYLRDLPPGASPPPAGAALGAVFADAVRGSLIITITARHRDPEAAALVANRYYTQFVSFLVAKGGGTSEEAIVFLQKRALEMQKEYEQQEQRLQEYKKQHNLISLDDSLNIVTDRLKTVNNARPAGAPQSGGLPQSDDRVPEGRPRPARDLLHYRLWQRAPPEGPAVRIDPTPGRVGRALPRAAPANDRNRPHDHHPARTAR